MSVLQLHNSRALRDKRPYLSEPHGVGAAILSRPNALIILALGFTGCVSPNIPSRLGDVFIVAGRPLQTGTRVVTWKDRGGFDAYRTARIDEAGAPASYGTRRAADGSTIAPGDFEALLSVVDQIVLHYDGIGNSRECFEHLAERQLSAHFLIDVDGTIYQTLDLQERAYHATVANNRSIGIEIANGGAFPADGDLTELLPGEVVRGIVHGVELVQPVFMPEQYTALSKLIDALCRTFPQIARDCPRDGEGRVVMEKLPDGALTNFRGVLGHFHIQENKVDPGPAFQWDRVF